MNINIIYKNKKKRIKVQTLESILSINNPVGSPPGGLKIDESSGSLVQPLTCHLIIKKIGF